MEVKDKMKEKTIVIGRDFSPIPTGRTRADGPFCGECFRDDYLMPALADNDCVIVDLAGVEGLGSSFLEEVFGGLVRNGRYSPLELQSKLKVITTDPLFAMCLPRISKYMEDARLGLSASKVMTEK